MPIRKKKCPICNIFIANQKKLCLNDNNKPSICIKVHSKKLKTGVVQYRCTNYKGHGWSERSTHEKDWYYVTFYDKPSFEGRRYLYQSSTLHDNDVFIKEHQEFARENFDTEIIEAIRLLDGKHPIKKYFQITTPSLFDKECEALSLPDDLDPHAVQILFYHLKGFSIDLIIEVLFADSRAYVRKVLKDFKSSSKINVENFSLNCSFTYHPSKHKIIESKYYNKYGESDFHYIN